MTALTNRLSIASSSASTIHRLWLGLFSRVCYYTPLTMYDSIDQSTVYSFVIRLHYPQVMTGFVLQRLLHLDVTVCLPTRRYWRHRPKLLRVVRVTWVSSKATVMEKKGVRIVNWNMFFYYKLVNKQANSKNVGPPPGNKFDLEVDQRSRSLHSANRTGLS